MAPGLAARIGRVLAIMVVFAAIGPLVGAAVLVAVLTGMGMRDAVDESQLHVFTLVGFLYAMPLSYWLGTAPAAAAGLAIGIRQAFFGRATWPMALAVGLIVGVVMLGRSGALPARAGDAVDSLSEFSAVIVLACLISTLVCWTLVRGWYVAPSRLPPVPGSRSSVGAAPGAAP
jgi:hypothetical protein